MSTISGSNAGGVVGSGSGSGSGSAGAGAGAAVFDISAKLRQRRVDLNHQKERTQASINGQTELLQRMFTHKSRRPRDTLAQMDAKMIELENTRTRTSIPLAAEKSILRQIDAIKKSKAQLNEYDEHERKIQEKKNEIAALRDSLRTTMASIAELESALSKVELANRLGCTVPELQTRIVDCPEGKLGFVIGKHGGTIKQIEERTGVQVDVDKVGMKIHLHGSESALDEAVLEVEKITLAVTDEIVISEALITYLLTKRLGAFAKLQKDNPNVYIDLSKPTSTMSLRGKPADVAAARKDLEGLMAAVISRVKSVSQKEAGLVVGKGGSTITKLCECHGVVLNVTNNNNKKGGGGGGGGNNGGQNNTTASAAAAPTVVDIIGPKSNVDAALASVTDILYQNEELEEVIVVRNMQRNKMLSNAAAAIKAVQSEVNAAMSGGGGCLLVFEKRERSQSREEMQEPSKLLIKTSRTNMDTAKGIVQKHVDAYEADILRVDVQPDIVPAVLGKGGAIINALRRQGLGAEIDIDKATGVCFIQSEDAETRATIQASIEKIVAENQTRKVDILKTMIGLCLGGESGKEMRGKIADIGANLSVDPADKYMILRGTVDQVNESASILQEFIDDNYTEEYEVPLDDQRALFQGGSESLLNKVETEHDVKANVRKVANTLIVRGRKENVTSALADVKRFLEGDGITFSVVKLKVPDGLLGFVIGKGGTNIAKLEDENEGVLIQATGDTSLLCFRGPVAAVEVCRSQVISQLATAKVTETVPLSVDQHDSLESSGDYLRNLGRSTATQMNLAETAVKIRGTSVDVKDAKASLLEHLTGTYTQTVELEHIQCTKVRAAAKDPSHFERIQSATHCEVSLDPDSSAILISGKRANVKKAKIFVMGFLDFLLPAEFEKIKVAKPLMKAMADPAELAKIAADSGASVSLDRDLSSVIVRSSVTGHVEKAAVMVNARLRECEKLNYVQHVDSSDLWLFPLIIGKGGVNIKALQEESGCSIGISKEELTIAISGSSEDEVKKGKDALFSIIDKAKKECVFIDLPESAMAAFIGKSGSHIKQLSSDHGVSIERMRKEPTRIQIKGDELSVSAAQEAVWAWGANWQSQNVGISIEIEDSVIPSILGKGGSTITSITADHHVRVDIDRTGLTVTIRGGSQTEREEAMNRISSIIEEHTAKKAELEEAQRKAVTEAAAAKPAPATATRSETPKEGKKAQPENDEQDDKPDRSKEFAAIPVGLTVVESTKRKSKQSKAKKTASNAAMRTPDSNTPPPHAGQSLFNMILADKVPQSPPDGLKLTTPGLVDEQWDSSTVSSGAISSGTENEEEPIASFPEKAQYKSTSGFVVRV